MKICIKCGTSTEKLYHGETICINCYITYIVNKRGGKKQRTRKEISALSTELIESIEEDTQALRNELGENKGRETEVYSRIVGYYRPVTLWNHGKKEEYRDREEFKI